MALLSHEARRAIFEIRSWPRLCENAKFENPNGKLPPIYSILRLENGFQWSVQVLTRPVMQRCPTCEKFKIVFTQPGSKGNEDRFMGWMLGFSQKAELHQAHISVPFSSQSAISRDLNSLASDTGIRCKSIAISWYHVLVPRIPHRTVTESH